MGRRERERGKRGERLWRDWLKDHFGCADAQRGQGQSRGNAEQADVIGGVPGTWPEVKFVQALAWHKALEQATDDGERHEAIPYVAAKRANESWKIICWSEHLKPLAVAVVRQCLRKGLLRVEDLLEDEEPQCMAVWPKRDRLEG